MKLIILGAGLVGAPMALDLANDSNFNVTVADNNTQNLAKFKTNKTIKIIQIDFMETEKLGILLKDYDMVISAVPGFMGYEILKLSIENKTNVIDIAFSPENPLKLDELAKKMNVTAVVDCGVAPGMSNLLTGYVDSLLDQTECVKIMVGGLPKIRKQPFEYQAPFSPVDVIEEYTRPAILLENGKLISKPALSDPEYVEFPEIGTLEAFNTDGLRTMAHTLKIPNMKEKTLRYPGHIDKIKLLKEIGFFKTGTIEIQNNKIRPLDFTSKLLFKHWKLKKGDEDITVMRIEIDGRLGGKKVRYTFSLYDQYDAVTRIHSMARTTGYTATTVCRLLAQNLYSKKGVIPLELLGTNRKCVGFILSELKNKGVVYLEKIDRHL